jgi:hypothetical protein
MKTILLSTVLMLFTTASFCQTLNALDEKYGFREAIFEMPKASFKNLVEVEKGFYTSTSENLTLGEYQIDKIVYKFYKDQLSLIMIKTKGYTNSTGILKILQTAYGKGYQSNEYVEEYSWRGSRVYMGYDQNSITDDATIIIWSNKLMDLEKAERKKANEEAASKL